MEPEINQPREGARTEEIKKAKGAPPWVEKLVVNEQIVGTLICQPSGHTTDTHYHLTDEWWVVLEGEIDWEIERAGAGPSIRLAITPPGEFHRYDRPESDQRTI